MPFLLSADIGGTHSRFALFAFDAATPSSPASAPASTLTLLRERRFATAEQTSFTELLGRLQSSGRSPFMPPDVALAVLGVAGPVENGVCRPPNIAWEIRAEDAAGALGIPKVALVNDFVAQGHACLSALRHARVRRALEIREISLGAPPEKAASRAPIALVGAGSGCGKALLLPESGNVLPSEGGHAEFPFRSEDAPLAAFLRERRGEKIIVEMLAGGRGLADIFAFHCGGEPTPAEAGARLNPPRPQAEEAALAHFARLYGRVCRNYVLDVLALGGLYVTGGVAGHVPVLEHPDFLRSFLDSDDMREVLRRVPVFQIRSAQAGLWGAAVHALHRDDDA